MIKKTDLSEQPCLGIIDNVPVYMIASKDPEKLNGVVPGRTKYNVSTVCGERYFERLPG